MEKGLSENNSLGTNKPADDPMRVIADSITLRVHVDSRIHGEKIRVKWKTAIYYLIYIVIFFWCTGERSLVCERLGQGSNVRCFSSSCIDSLEAVPLSAVFCFFLELIFDEICELQLFSTAARGAKSVSSCAIRFIIKLFNNLKYRDNRAIE